MNALHVPKEANLIMVFANTAQQERLSIVAENAPATPLSALMASIMTLAQKDVKMIVLLKQHLTMQP